MLAGNSRKDYSLDLLYNTDPEVFKSIQDSLARISHDAESESDNAIKMRYLRDAISGEGLVNVYNAMRDGHLNDGWTTNTYGESAINKHSKPFIEAISDIDALARMYKDEEGTPFEKMEKALRQYTQELGQASKKEKEQQEQQMQQRINTCSNENNPYGAEIDENSKAHPKFKEVVNWLKSLQATNNKKKIFKQMEKMSDIQKISAVEFAKPKMLFMKKLVNKDFWFRGQTKADRYLHCITDFSGSMGSYMKNRNVAWQLLFDKCNELGISIENTLFNHELNLETAQQWKSQADLDKAFKLSPDGDDNLGRATIDKLNLLKRTKEKQYLIAISDGTGSFSSTGQSEKAKALALEKNVELKFILFSSQNSMGSIPKEDIFYVY